MIGGEERGAIAEEGGRERERERGREGRMDTCVDEHGSGLTRAVVRVCISPHPACA